MGNDLPLSNKNKLLHLEGLRGVAALIVVFCHFKNAFAHKADIWWFQKVEHWTGSILMADIAQSFLNVFFDGFLAVYVFYFMSAYVISIKLFNKEKSRNYLISAITKRYFRLAIPVLGSILFAFILMKLGFMYNKNPNVLFYNGTYNEWLGSFYLFDPNFLGALKNALWDSFFNYKTSTSYNPVLWTMNPELYGSMFCFLLFAVFGKNRFRYYIYGACIVLFSYLFEFWMVTFILGLWFCDMNYGNHKRTQLVLDRLEKVFSNKYWISAILAVVLFYLAGKPNFFGVTDAFLSPLIVILIMHTPYLKRFFSWKPFVWLGKISFGLYLVHLPIILSFSSFLFITLNVSLVPKLFILFLSTTFLSLIVAYLFTFSFDRSGILFSNKMGQFFLKLFKLKKDTL